MASPPLPMYPPPIPMTGIKHPTNHDVKSGRGVSTNSWPGNERFRSLVNCNKELYVTSTKRQKMSISRSIVDAVRSLDPPGRFLEKNQETGLWSDIGDKKAIEKTSQALRDGAAALRKQLSADMNDPDFLSAVFDSTAPMPEGVVGPPTKKPPSKKKGKKGPAKGHRRVKSNPTVGSATKTRALMKKVRSGEAVPLSPKSSVSLPVIPRPPQSPISPGSDNRGSPGFEVERMRSPNQDDPFRRESPFRRAQQEQGTYPGSPSGYGLPGRSASFDYHDLDRGQYEYEPPYQPGQPRSPPMAYGHYSSPPSPSGYSPFSMPLPYPVPSPRSPRRHFSPRGPPRELSPGSHCLPPSGYRNGPPSPRVAWSPRQFNNRTGTPSLSPHPYMHPLDTPPSFRSPDRRPMLSPRMTYSHDPGRISPGLAVPTLGGERGPQSYSPPSPMWRCEPGPYSPRSCYDAPQPADHPEFLPPPPPPPHQRRPERSPEYRYASPTYGSMKKPRYPDSAESQGHNPGPPHEQCQGSEPEPYDESRFRPEEKRYPCKSPRRPSESMVPEGDSSSQSQLRPEEKRYPHKSPRKSSDHPSDEPECQPSDFMISQRESISQPPPSPPINVKMEESLDSPAGIADLVREDMTTPVEEEEEGFEVSLSGIELSTSRDSQDYPYDEDNPAAYDDDCRMSPLPFDEDPTSLMELPDNLLKLPISPVGPQDDST